VEDREDREREREEGRGPVRCGGMGEGNRTGLESEL
jgi:hypothetical protein